MHAIKQSLFTWIIKLGEVQQSVAQPEPVAKTLGGAVGLSAFASLATFLPETKRLQFRAEGAVAQRVWAPLGRGGGV